MHFLSTTNITTFNNYASGVFVPHIMKHLETSERVDVVPMGYLHHQQHKGVNKGEARQKYTTEGGWSEQAARELARFSARPYEQAGTIYVPLQGDCILARWQAGLHYIWHQSGRHRHQPLHAAM